MKNSRTNKAKELLEYNKISNIKELWGKTGYTIESIAKELNLNILDVELIVLIYNIDKLLQTSRPKKDNMEFLQVDDDTFIRIDTITGFEDDIVEDSKTKCCRIYDESGEEYGLEGVSIRKLVNLLGAKIVKSK